MTVSKMETVMNNTFWKDAEEHLKAPLSPDAVKPPPKGKFGEYVDGLHIINEANRIFGHGGWSYEITRLELASRIETTDSNGNPQVRVSYACTVRVDVQGVKREGAAVGIGISKADNEADAHESAYKEAETDAMKRGFRSFGNTFGLALYEKDKSKRQVGDPDQFAEIVSDMCSATTGRDLLDIVRRAGAANDNPAVIDARVNALRNIVRGAQSPDALLAMQKNFSPDWGAVKSDAEARRLELTNEE